MLADAPLAHLLHRRPRTLSLPTGHAPIASGGSNSCRVGYLPPTGSTCPFHGARFLRARNRRIGRSALKARLKADYNFHIKPRIEGLLQIGYLCVALSALALLFLGLPRAALRAETGLRLPSASYHK